MFSGIKPTHKFASVDSYADALRVLEDAGRTPTGRKRREKEQGFPLGGRSKSVTWVRETGDEGAIAFRLYDTDVVTWFPDDSCEIDNFGSVTTTAFARQFAPGSIHLHYPTRGGGHRGISYSPDGAGRDRIYGGDGGWENRHLCQGDVVRFVRSGDWWVPDEDTVCPMDFIETDQQKARKISRRYPLKDFSMWLEMTARTLPYTIEHDSWDLGSCADALLAQDFRRAATHLPLIDASGTSFGRSVWDYALPIAGLGRSFCVTMGSVERLKLALWEQEGAVRISPRKTITMHEYERQMARIRQMQKLGMHRSYSLGPR